MDTLRTPGTAFDSTRAAFPHEPVYVEVDDPDGGEPLRMATYRTGPDQGEVVVLLHGEPTWSYLYRKVMARLADRGMAAVAVDLVGFGRSDKPTSPGDHSYARHVAWVGQALDRLGLAGFTLVGQDWGGLIGLRLVAERPELAARVVAANTGLPTGDHEMPEIWWMFRRAVESADTLEVGRFVEAGCGRGLAEEDRAAYDAPFPTEEHKAGAKAMPGLVPTAPDDPASAANRAAWEKLAEFQRPFLVAFSDGDPITGPMAPVLRQVVPTAAAEPETVITGAGHFLQEDAGAELADAVADFIDRHPR